MAQKSSALQTGGNVFLILGLVFIVLGASGQTTFLWIGIPFLITGWIEIWLSRGPRNRGTSSAEDHTDSQER